MKANEVPEKIFISYETDKDGYIYTDYMWHRHQFEGVENIEYTRTDAFIEKAKEAFCKASCNGHPPRSTCTSLGTCKEYDNFVKFIKRE